MDAEGVFSCRLDALKDQLRSSFVSDSPEKERERERRKAPILAALAKRPFQGLFGAKTAPVLLEYSK